MAPMVDEMALVSAARAGDGAAFALLAGRYQDRLYKASYRLLGNREDADDIVQEALLRAYRALARTDDGLNFGAWLVRIALNAGRDLLRRRRLRQELPWETLNSQASQDPEDNPLGNLIDAEDRIAVRRALELLPMHYRQALMLRESEGLSHKDIGAIVGKPPSVVRVLVFRSKAAFRTAYQGVEATGTYQPRRRRRPDRRRQIAAMIAGGTRGQDPAGASAPRQSRSPRKAQLAVRSPGDMGGAGIRRPYGQEAAG